MKNITQLISMITCFLLIVSMAIIYNEKILGTSLNVNNNEFKTIDYNSDGNVLINTIEIAKDINGYGGNIPLILHINNNIITKIDILNNSETPDFINKIKNKLLPKYIGKNINDNSINDIDAISGATLTSNAIKLSINRGINYFKGNSKDIKNNVSIISVKILVAILVILSASVVPLFFKSNEFRFIQLILNIVVLGLWCGSFISYSSLISLFSNGITSTSSILLIMLLITAFIYPIFNKKNYYCTWICPLGSMQELTGKCIKRKINISQDIIRYLQTVRQILWGFLMLFMWSGMFMEWIDYEPFSIFIYSNASIPVIIIAIIFILLSFIINRPYCRFVCPTGTLLRISQNSKL